MLVRQILSILSSFLTSFHLNVYTSGKKVLLGHILGFHPQIQQLEPPCIVWLIEPQESSVQKLLFEWTHFRLRRDLIVWQQMNSFCNYALSVCFFLLMLTSDRLYTKEHHRTRYSLRIGVETTHQYNKIPQQVCYRVPCNPVPADI